MAVLTLDHEIGSPVEAAIAANISFALPKGWQYLGQGVSRAAYLSPSGIVYKVPHEAWLHSVCNTGEYEVITEIRASGSEDAQHAPLTALYEVNDTSVIAMEFIPLDWGCSECQAVRYTCIDCEEHVLSKLNDLMERWGCMGDCHWQNVRRREDGTPVIIDWGSRS